MADLMKGKRGLIMGVANSHSIAWGIAKELADNGAELAFTYQGEAFGKRVAAVAEQLGSKLLCPAMSRISRPSTRFSRRWKRNGARSISSSTPSASPTSRSSRAAMPM